MREYLARIMAFGADYAFRQLFCDMKCRGLTPKGRAAALAALVGFASRD